MSGWIRLLSARAHGRTTRAKAGKALRVPVPGCAGGATAVSQPVRELALLLGSGPGFSVSRPARSSHRGQPWRFPRVLPRSALLLLPGWDLLALRPQLLGGAAGPGDAGL